MSDHEYDVRVVEHKLRRRELNQDQVKAILEALPDSADEAVETETRFTAPYHDRLTGDHD